MDEAARDRVAACLAERLQIPSLRIEGARKLAGGAIQQNHLLDMRIDGIAQRWVLRTDSASSVGVSHGRAAEYALLRAAYAAGVTVPEPLALVTDTETIGQPFFVMRAVEGTALGHVVTRDDTLGGGRESLAEALGRELARIHAIAPPRDDLAFLRPPGPDGPARRAIADLHAALDVDAVPRPVLEWGLRHLARRAPEDGEWVLCHNDFRTGNLMLDRSGVTGVLDWEFAAWGEPHADIGWLCARCWRFGSGHEVGGIGSRAAFARGYEPASGRRIDPMKVRRWELLATIRWAVIAAQQVARFNSGAERSLELALTGHVIPDLELDILAMVDSGA